jgi:hypothetical protein
MNKGTNEQTNKRANEQTNKRPVRSGWGTLCEAYQCEFAEMVRFAHHDIGHTASGVYGGDVCRCGGVQLNAPR